VSVVSIRPFLEQPEDEVPCRADEAVVYRRAIAMLLDGVATYALDLDREARQSFCDRLGGIRRSMDAEANLEAVLEHAGSAVRAIGDYARQTTRLVHAQSAEMQNMIAMLARAVTGIGGAAGRAVARLRKIGDDAERVAALAPGSTLKMRARECCDGIRMEAGQQETDWERMAQTLQREMSRKEEAWRALGLDTAVEQPGEAVAQAQLLSALHCGGQEHIAVFVLDAARIICRQFGRVAGDESIRALKQSLAAHLALSDPMFRWSDAAVVVSLAGEYAGRVRDRLEQLSDQPFERTFEVNGRPVTVRLAVAWAFFALSPPLADLNRRINDFVASRDCEEEDV